MHAISRRLALLALGALVLVGTACGDDEPSGTGDGISGTYALRTVNTMAVPATLYHSGEGSTGLRLEVASGQVTLGANDTFELTTLLRETTNGSVAAPRRLTGSGTYTRTGSLLRLTDTENALTYTLTVQSDGALVQTGTISGFPVSARYVK